MIVDIRTIFWIENIGYFYFYFHNPYSLTRAENSKDVYWNLEKNTISILSKLSLKSIILQMESICKYVKQCLMCTVFRNSKTFKSGNVNEIKKDTPDAKKDWFQCQIVCLVGSMACTQSSKW